MCFFRLGLETVDSQRKDWFFCSDSRLAYRYCNANGSWLVGYDGKNIWQHRKNCHIASEENLLNKEYEVVDVDVGNMDDSIN